MFIESGDTFVSWINSVRRAIASAAMLLLLQVLLYLFLTFRTPIHLFSLAVVVDMITDHKD